MKLAVSNIAWAPEEMEAACRILAERGVTGIEIAPGLAFAGEPDPIAPGAAAVQALRARFAAAGLQPVSMQSLLFGVRGAQLFGTAEERGCLDAAMERAMACAARLGIPNLVFGSPANRRIPPGMSPEDARARAQDTFASMGKRAAALDMSIALEPVPERYGTNFLTSAAATAEFVAALGHEAITLNFDIGAILFDGDEGEVPGVIATAGRRISHVHISAPNLDPAPADVPATAAIIRRLRDGGYGRWYSIEMRRPEGADALSNLASCVERAREAMASAG